MRIPKYLPKNGNIGFIAPSFGCNIEPYKTAFNNALKKFHSMGFETTLGFNVYEGQGVGISNSPKKCAEEVNQFFTDNSIDAIISCGGGELMCEILEYIDFDKIKNSEAKWFLGYSDNTNLTFLLNTICHQAAVYGSCAPTFGMNEWHEALHDTMDFLTGNKKTFKGYDSWEKESLKSDENPLVSYNTTEKTTICCFDFMKREDISFSGVMLGGCLDCLAGLVGTKFDRVEDFKKTPGNSDIIWFLESCDLNLMGIRRALWQLKNAGWFENAAGFIIGRPLCYGTVEFGIDHYQAFLEPLKCFGVPIIMDADIGHLPPSMPVISGMKANVEFKEKKINIKYF